jgi:hypothetical protein
MLTVRTSISKNCFAMSSAPSVNLRLPREETPPSNTKTALVYKLGNQSVHDDE